MLLLLQVSFIEVIDLMVGQIIRRLHEAEQAGAGRYCLLVTADHSTPVLFGDHSHEPVPLAIAHVRHVVRLLPRSAMRHVICVLHLRA